MKDPLPFPWTHDHLSWPFFILLIWFAAAVLLWDVAWRLSTVRFSILLFGSLVAWAIITVSLWIALGLPW